MHHEELISTIVERRKSLKVTQELLSDLSDVSLRTIKQFESGKSNPTLKTLYDIVDVLGFEVCLKLKTLNIKDEKG